MPRDASKAQLSARQRYHDIGVPTKCWSTRQWWVLGLNTPWEAWLLKRGGRARNVVTWRMADADPRPAPTSDTRAAAGEHCVACM